MGRHTWSRNGIDVPSYPQNRVMGTISPCNTPSGRGTQQPSEDSFFGVTPLARDRTVLGFASIISDCA
jgi:hypothetical protein